ncbi:MAG: 2-keto-4-pentenoate hydratase, partial [Bdellovibrionales bacterium]
MKLATLKNSKSRDGELVVVSRDNRYAVKVPQIASSLREAIEKWSTSLPQLEKIYTQINAGAEKSAFELQESLFHSPLPRSFQWADGSAFI